MTINGKAIDAKAKAKIEAMGWTIISTKPRFVAEKKVFEEKDDSTTRRFESFGTLEGLARTVQRREREEADRPKAVEA